MRVFITNYAKMRMEHRGIGEHMVIETLLHPEKLQPDILIDMPWQNFSLNLWEESM